jgi:hypothetical protein
VTSGDDWFSWALLALLAAGAVASALAQGRRAIEQQEGVEEAETPTHRRRPVSERRPMVTRPHVLPAWEE